MKDKPLTALIIGAGDRGMYKFGELSKREDINLKVIAVAEPDEKKREKMVREHLIADNRCYETGEEALKQNKFCDVVINTTPDKIHHRIAIMALEKGYHLLLEKPMSTSAKNCVDIIKAQKKSGKILSVTHVLRYAPFFQEIKKIIDSGELGKIKLISIEEDVAYWHFAHSYVRGNWRRKDETGPIILTKSCHDMDLFTWLTNSELDSIEAEGSLKYFIKKNAPSGSTKRCVQDCKVKKSCIYNAERFYLYEKDSAKVIHPMTVISPIDKSVVARKKALETGPYGRCVYRCDNDVNDNELVIMKFKNGVEGIFRLNPDGRTLTRHVKINFEKGEVKGNLAEGRITFIKYTGIHHQDIKRNIQVNFRDGHGGGDEFLLKSFIKAIKTNNEKHNLTSAPETLQSHLMCFAAEESQKKGKPVNFIDYKRKLRI